MVILPALQQIGLRLIYKAEVVKTLLRGRITWKPYHDGH